MNKCGHCYTEKATHQVNTPLSITVRGALPNIYLCPKCWDVFKVLHGVKK